MEVKDSSTQEGSEEEEDVETQARPSRRKRKRSDSGRGSRSTGEAMLKFMMDYREEKKAREEMQLKAMQQMHREKMTIFAGLLEIMKK